MTNEELIRQAGQFVQDSPFNYVSAEEALSPEMVGLRIYDEPAWGFGDADDPMFRDMQKREAVGPQFMLPGQWLEGAKSVISFFLPSTDAVKRSNIGGELPSKQWLHARIQGQRMVIKLCEFVRDLLQEQGARCVIPATDKRCPPGPKSESRKRMGRRQLHQQLVGAARGLCLRARDLLPVKGSDHRAGDGRTDWQHRGRSAFRAAQAGLHWRIRLLHTLWSLCKDVSGWGYHDGRGQGPCEVLRLSWQNQLAGHTLLWMWQMSGWRTVFEPHPAKEIERKDRLANLFGAANRFFFCTLVGFNVEKRGRA